MKTTDCGPGFRIESLVLKGIAPNRQGRAVALINGREIDVQISAYHVLMILAVARARGCAPDGACVLNGPNGNAVHLGDIGGIREEDDYNRYIKAIYCLRRDLREFGSSVVNIRDGFYRIEAPADRISVDEISIAGLCARDARIRACVDIWNREEAVRGHHRFKSSEVSFGEAEKNLVINSRDGSIKNVKIPHAMLLVIVRELNVTGADLSRIPAAKSAVRAKILNRALARLPEDTPVQVSTHLRTATMFLVG